MISKKIDLMFASVIMVVATIISLYIAYNTMHLGYKNLFVIPFFYGILYTFFISPIRRKLNNIYIHIFIAVSITRYIILPFLITFTGHYSGRSSVPPMDESFNAAIYLMLYEMFIVSIATYMIFRKVNLNERIEKKSIHLPKTNFVYIIFIAFSLSLGFIFPSSFKSFAFLKFSDSFMDLGFGSIYITLTTYFLVISKLLLFVLISSFLFRKYKKTSNPVYVVLSFIAVFFNISIFYGNNRADYIIVAIASILLFGRLYPRFIKYSIVPLLLTMILSISLINEQRDQLTATGGVEPLTDLTNTLQVYLAGPYNVAIALEATELNEQNREPIIVIHELLRPVIGLNVFLKQIDVKSTSDYFNERIYFSDQKSQIVPMIGQGYFYFGFFLSPIITILFLYFVRFLILFQSRQSQIEIIFFFSIPIARIGFATAQNGAILANDISFFLVLFTLVYVINSKITIKNQIGRKVRVRKRIQLHNKFDN